MDVLTTVTIVLSLMLCGESLMWNLRRFEPCSKTWQCRVRLVCRINYIRRYYKYQCLLKTDPWKKSMTVWELKKQMDLHYGPSADQMNYALAVVRQVSRKPNSIDQLALDVF